MLSALPSLCVSLDIHSAAVPAQGTSPGQEAGSLRKRHCSGHREKGILGTQDVNPGTSSANANLWGRRVLAPFVCVKLTLAFVVLPALFASCTPAFALKSLHLIPSGFPGFTLGVTSLGAA